MTPDKRSTKRPADALNHDLDTARKRPRQDRQYPTDPLVEEVEEVEETSGKLDSIDFWPREGRRPREYFELNMEHILARKRPLSARKRSNFARSTSTTPSDQKPREEKSPP